MKTPGSNFVSWFGLGFILALILVSAYFEMATLESFLIIVFILCLIAFLWGKLSLAKMELKNQSEDCCGFPGATLEAEFSVKNRKMLPLIWLDLVLPIGKKTCIEQPDKDEEEGEGSKKTRSLRSTFLWLMPHQTIRWKQTALAVHRGVCRVEEATLHSGDGFGLSTQTLRRKLEQSLRFVVYPKLVDVDVSPILNKLTEMESARNGFYTDRTLLETTRDYREGDSFKNINWRLLARKDELHVNVYEKLTMRRVCFMPDLMSFTHVEEIIDGNERREERVVETENMEEMFSLMASLMVKLHEKGVLCSLVVPAIGEKSERIIMPESAETQIMELLGALAEIEYDAEGMRLPLEAIDMNRHKLGRLYVLSRDAKRSCLSERLPGVEELGAISIFQESPSGEDSGDGSYFSETDLRIQ